MWRQILLYVIGFGLFISHVQASEVVAIGSAEIYGGNINSARDQALRNAQRQAVEQGVGALIDSQTISKNFQIIKDEVLSSSRGFVTRYEILQEGRTSGGAVYQVKIKAEVSDKGIKDKLTALRILHKQMGNKRMMIIYRKSDPKALKRNYQTIPALMGNLRDVFNQSGFRIFNDRVTQKVYKIIEVSTLVNRPDESLISIALDQQAEILVAVEMIAGKQSKRAGSSFSAIKADVRLSIYDVSTGRQIADVVGSGKKLSAKRLGSFEEQQYLRIAGEAAARKAGSDAISKITDYYKSLGDQGFAYLIVLRNYTQDEEDDILDYLESVPGFRDITELKNSPNYLELELFSTEKKTRLRRKIRRDLRKEGIELTSQESSGNRLLFIKPGTEHN